MFGVVVVGNNRVRSLNTRNRDVGSDDVNSGVDTREIISRVKPDFFRSAPTLCAASAPPRGRWRSSFFRILSVVNVMY